MPSSHINRMTDLLFGKMPLADKGTDEITHKMFNGLTIAMLFTDEQMKKINGLLKEKNQKALVNYLIEISEHLKTKKTTPKFVYEKICEIYNLKPYKLKTT